MSHKDSIIVTAVLPRDKILHLLRNKLEPSLPYSLSLTRRLQYSLRNGFTKTAEVFIAVARSKNDDRSEETFLAKWLTQKFTQGDGQEDTTQSLPWLATHIDLCTTGQTQVWMHASWEVPEEFGPSKVYQKVSSLPTLTTPPTNLRVDDPQTVPLDPLRDTLVKSVFSHIYYDLVPQVSEQPSADWLELLHGGKNLSKPYIRSKVLFGDQHDVLLPHYPRQAVRRLDPGYQKFIFDPLEALGSPSDKQITLPPGYSWRSLTKAELKTVLDRSPIPRTLGLLKTLINVAVIYNSMENGSGDMSSSPAIGWGFLTKDAMIGSLHVEPDHRGRGLALIMTRKLMSLQRVNFTLQHLDDHSNGALEASGEFAAHINPTEGPWYGGADVSLNNTPSLRVMEKAGGRIMWGVSWIEIDLAALFEGLEK